MSVRRTRSRCRHDAAAFRNFEVRNVAANGVVWTFTTLREPTKASIGSRVNQLKAQHGHIGGARGAGRRSIPALFARRHQRRAEHRCDVRTVSVAMKGCIARRVGALVCGIALSLSAQLRRYEELLKTTPRVGNLADLTLLQ